MRSMTGFGASQGGVDGVEWRWDLRSVNGRGLEVRFRTPAGWETYERAWRARIAAQLSRGSVTAWLGIGRPGADRGEALDLEALARAAAAAKIVARRLEAEGLAVAPISPAALLALKGVYGEDRPAGPAPGPLGGAAEAGDSPLVAAISAGLETALASLATSRADEGARLATILAERLEAVRRLSDEAAAAAQRRGASVAERLRQRLAAILEAAATGSNGQLALDEGRLAQELALLAVKADVTEELDRLGAHLASARALVAATEPIGRKLEFLAQELNREANTLCAKSQDAALTETGLRLKAAIDQIREQAANVE